MSDIICPYCGDQMQLRELGHVKKIVFYECPQCLSCSPQTTNSATAKGMAMMRGKHTIRTPRARLSW